MDIRAVIFDKDGTLIDFAATFNPATRLVLDELCSGDKALMQQAADALGYDLEKMEARPGSVLIAGSGIDMSHALATVLPIKEPAEFSVELDALYGEICQDTVEKIPGVDKTLEHLHLQDVTLGIATNDAQANAVLQMEVLELDHLFEHIIGADSGYGAKPGSGMIDAFTDVVGFAPHQVMMVGDSYHDLEAGRNAGVMTCGVETGPATRAELEPYGDFVIASINELPALIGV